MGYDRPGRDRTGRDKQTEYGSDNKIQGSSHDPPPLISPQWPIGARDATRRKKNTVAKIVLQKLNTIVFSLLCQIRLRTLPIMH
jgi:hypothetical protein